MSDKISILLADDHQMIIDGLKFMLEKEEHLQITATFNSTQEVLNHLEKDPSIDLLITDVNMPTISGIELCRKAKELLPNLKVLILSMYSSKEIVKEALMAEADGYILKSGGKEMLLTAIDKIMNNGSYYSEEIIPIIVNQYKHNQQKETKIHLSPREEEVLKLIVNELTSKEIAEKLFISKQTVDTHRMNIMQKTGSKSLVGLIKFAVQEGYLK